MNAKDIVDEVSLKAWLNAQPATDRYRDAVLIAQRAAARLFPVVVKDQFNARPSQEKDRTILIAFRGLLTAAVAVASHSAEVRRAAVNARSATNELTDADGQNHGVAVALGAANAAVYTASVNPAVVGADSDFTGSAARTAAFADHFTDIHADLWRQVRFDAALLGKTSALAATRLWSGGPPDWFQEADAEFSSFVLDGDAPFWKGDEQPMWTDPDDPIWKIHPDWAFVARWWNRFRSGQSLDSKLLERVVLIDSAVWQAGPAAVAEAIREIEKQADGAAERHDQLTQQLSRIEPGTTNAIANVREAIFANRRELPPTLDAVLGYITLEIHRLQTRNYRSAEDEEECKRQIGVLTTIHLAVSGLLALVPSEQAATVPKAEEAEKLTRLFTRKIQEWPRANAEDLVDSAYRAALIGVTVIALPLLGVSSVAALTAGTVLFGGKKVLEAAKAAKDYASPPKP